jgi:hypothetical protein
MVSSANVVAVALWVDAAFVRNNVGVTLPTTEADTDYTAANLALAR